MKKLFAILTLLSMMSLVAGCYYYEDSYYRDPYYTNGRNYPQAVQPDPNQPPSYGGQASPWDQTDPQDMPPAPPLDPENDPALDNERMLEDAGLVAGENWDLVVRFVGVSSETKGDIEGLVRGIEGVDMVGDLYYRNGELGLGLKYGGSIRALHQALFQVTGKHARRFVVEMTGEATPKTPLEVRIFAPADGSRLSSNMVFVGIEVKGAENPSVSVNGIPAEPLPVPGKFRARIQCPAGKNQIVARVQDGQGRAGKAAITILVGEGDVPVDPGGLTVLIQGKVADPLSTVTVDGQPVKVEPDGTYKTEVALKEGQSFVSVVVVDSLGNRTMRKIPVSGR